MADTGVVSAGTESPRLVIDAGPVWAGAVARYGFETYDLFTTR